MRGTGLPQGRFTLPRRETASLVLVSATGSRSAADRAAIAAVIAATAAADGRPVLWLEAGESAAPRAPGPVNTEIARSVTAIVEERLPRGRAAARGGVCHLALGGRYRPVGPAEGAGVESPATSGAGFEATHGGSTVALLAELTRRLPAQALCVASLDPPSFRAAVEDPGLEVDAAVLAADVRQDRPILALAVGDLRSRGIRCRVWKRRPGWLRARAALLGIAPGGRDAADAERVLRWLGRSDRPTDGSGAGSSPSVGDSDSDCDVDGGYDCNDDYCDYDGEVATPTPARRLAGEAGQVLPLTVGMIAVLVMVALVMVAFGGAVTGKGRAQRAADLAAVSAAKSLRDDLPRRLAPPVVNGAPNPYHMPKAVYLGRARFAAHRAGLANRAAPWRLRVSFPDRLSPAPLSARVRLSGSVTASAGDVSEPQPFRVSATAKAALPQLPAGGLPLAGGTDTGMASGGGYSGVLEYRQGKGMRPDVAAAFDAMAAAASAQGHPLIVNSAFRSDAEQADLFAANPDPKWVAPPGTSLHRCATELDLGPSSTYGWLAANAPRFGFEKRYSWEDWHFGIAVGPPPCSDAGERLAAGAGRGADGKLGGGGLPAFVPAAYREPIARAAARWNVSAELLAVQIQAESNFDPNAVSSAGAQGISQFMPATAASYGLADPFDPERSIMAQAEMMAGLLEQFGSADLALAAYNAGPGAVGSCGCIPSYPETIAYVGKILGLVTGLAGVGAGFAGAGVALEVRLVD